MAEEEKKEQAKEQAPKEEVKEQAKEQTPKEETKEETSEASEAPATARKKIKVTKMSLKQVEEALDAVKKSMGGYHSRYAQYLLERKKVLAGK